jgi:SAM-dependent methyltransferase
MTADWNERYKQGFHEEPDPFVVDVIAGIVAGRALDVACGAGRHAIWLAERGWKVTAVDNSSAAIEILQQHAREKAVAISSDIADLERHEFLIRPESYDLILICKYLQWDLFPSIKAGVPLGGIVVAAIAMVDDSPGTKPMNPAYLVRPGDLRAQFEGWELIRDCEGRPPGHQRQRAEIAARRIS